MCSGVAVVKSVTRNFTGDRKVQRFGVVVTSVSVFAKPFKCILKIGHMLCKLYLSKVEFLKNYLSILS